MSSKNERIPVKELTQLMEGIRELSEGFDKLVTDYVKKCDELDRIKAPLHREPKPPFS